MKKYWFYNILFSFSILILFITILYLCDVYKGIGHFIAISLIAVLGLQLLVGIAYAAFNLKKFTSISILLGLFSVLLLIAAILYTWNILFIKY
jgi:hypothetical protein